MIRVHSKSGRFIALLPDGLTGGFSVVVTSDGVGSHAARLSFDGEAILALSQDAQDFGDRMMEKRRAKLAEKGDNGQ